MKKKLLALLFTTLLVCVVAGCNLFTSPVTNIEWKVLPASEYAIITDTTPSASKLNFEVKITETISESTAKETTINCVDGILKYTNAGTEVTVPTSDYTITNFDLTKTGTRTAKLKLYNLTLDFQYTVRDPSASNELVDKGNHTYDIATADQFMMIVLGAQATNATKDYTYNVVNDIDFSEVDSALLNDYTAKIYSDGFVFNGTIDAGKYSATEYLSSNYKLMNYNAVARGEENQGGLFFNLGNCTFKNIDIVNFRIYNTASAGAGIFGMGYYSKKIGSNYLYTFKNINMYNSSITGGKNSGLFVGYAGAGTSVAMDNCYIDTTCSIMDNDSTSGGFVGSTSNNSKDTGASGTFTFNKCKMSGLLSAKSNCGALIGNSSAFSSTVKVEATDCIYDGKMYILTNTIASIDKPFFGGQDTHDKVTMTNCNDKAKIFTSVDNSYNGTKAIQRIIGTVAAANGTEYFTVDNKVSFEKYTSADKYVVSISYVVQGSTCVWTEELTQPTTGTTLTTNMSRILQGYTTTYATAHGIAHNVNTGIMVADRYSERTYLSLTTAATTSVSVSWIIVAYDTNGIAIGSASGSYKGNAILEDYSEDATKKAVVGFTYSI